MGNLSGVPGYAFPDKFYFISENVVPGYKALWKRNGGWTLKVEEAAVFTAEDRDNYTRNLKIAMNGEFMEVEEAENWGIIHQANKANMGERAIIKVVMLEKQAPMYVGPFNSPLLALDFANKFFHRWRFVVIVLDSPHMWTEADPGF